MRLFNTAGPRQVGHYGWSLPRLVHQAVHGMPLTVYGDGTQRRRFCHVQDVGPCPELMVAPDAEGQAFNVGSQDEISIRHLAERIQSS